MAPVDRSDGFTLLEVLVALSLVGVLMTLVYTGMHTGLRSWDAVQKRSDSAVTERATRNWLQRQVGALVPIAWRGADRTRIAFLGDGRGFRFFAPLAHASRGGGLYHVELHQEETDGAQVLALAYQPRQTEQSELAGVGDIEVRHLGERFDALQFEYFGALDERDQRRWRRDWPARAVRYPELIRISGERVDARPWPQLVVALRNTALEVRL